MERKLRKCDQHKCMYYKENTGCPNCSKCNAEPNLVDDDCMTCLTCKLDEGELRAEPEIPEGVIQIEINADEYESEVIALIGGQNGKEN